MAEPQTALDETALGTHENTDDAVESTGGWVWSLLGVGLVAGAGWLAAHVVTDTETGRGFPEVRGSIGWTLIVVGGVVVVGTLVPAVMRDSRRIVLAVRTLSAAGWIVVVIVACGTGMFLRHRYSGDAHSQAVTAVWMSLVGIALAATIGGEATSPRRGASGLRAFVIGPVAVLIPVVVAVVSTGMPERAGSAVVRVVREDMHSWPTANDDPVSGLEVHGVRIAGGVLTETHKLINADTGTVRWRVDTSGAWVSTFVELTATLIVVSEPGLRGDPETVAIDLESGDVRWRAPIAIVARTVYGTSRSWGSASSTW